MATEYRPGDLPYPEQDDRKLFCKFHYKGVLIFLVPMLLAPILMGPQILAYRYIYLTMCIYVYYILNVMPPGAVAFLYIVFLPIAGIAGSKGVSMAHYTDLIFLSFGSVFLGVLLDLSKISERLAICIIKICGANLLLLQVFFLIVVSFSSFLFNSTFVAAFWMKAAQAIMTEYNEVGVVPKDSDEETYERGAPLYPSKPAIGIYLTVAYASNLGAMISPFQDPNGQSVDLFNYYLGKGTASNGSLPIVLIGPFFLGMLAVFLWMNLMYLGLIRGKVKADLEERAVNKERLGEFLTERKEALGPWTIYPKLTLVFLIITLLALFTRRPRVVMGWDDIIKKTTSGASVVIIGICVLFFALPLNCLFCNYFLCRRPEKEGRIPSFLNWKAVNANVPWGHMFMLAAAFCCTYGGLQSRFYELARDTLVRKNLNSSSGLFYGSVFGTLLTILSPATALCQRALPYMMQVGFKGTKGPGIVGVPFMTVLHNQFLLPVSTPPNTIVAGWGNLRPYQFLVGGLVPTIVLFVFIPAFTKFLGGAAFSGYTDPNFNTTFTFTTFKPE